MKFIFDWCQEIYEEKNNWRGDVKILDLDIFQREGSFACAKVSIVPNEYCSFFSKKYAKIGVLTDEENSKIELLFSGRVISFPISLDASYIKLELIAEPDNYQKQLSEFIQKNITEYNQQNKHAIEKKIINFDELFFNNNDLSNPTVFLEGQSNQFYWDMKNGKLSLSNINKGIRNFEIFENQILDRSIKISLAREPYKNVKINLSVNWIQYLSGLIDLYPSIAAKFSDGIVNSLTNIQKKFKKLCEIDKNGYRLLHYDVKEVNPSQIIPMQNFSLTSNEIIVDRDSKENKKSIKFKKFYFFGEILLNWNQQQKRSESVTINVTNKKIEHGKEKILHLKLNPIQLSKQYPNWNFFSKYMIGDKVLFDGFIWECNQKHISGNKFDENNWNKIKKIPDALINDYSSSFFETARGKNSIKYALQNTIALMNYSSRYVEISFLTEAENFIYVNVSDQITLHSKKFNGEKITGKIIKTQLLANNKRKLMRITIGCTLGNDITDSNEKINEYIAELQNCLNNKKNKSNTLEVSDIIREIEIKNPPEYQEQIISEKNSIKEIVSQLKKHSTDIKITLAPLNSEYTLSETKKLPDFILN